MKRERGVPSRLLRLSLMAVDVVLINVAFYVAYWMRYVKEWGGEVDPAFQVPYTQYVPVAVVLTALLLITLTIEGVYNKRVGTSLFEELYAILNGTTTAVVLMIVIFYFYRPYSYSRLIFAYVAVLSVALLSGARLVERFVRYQLRKRGIGVVRLLIVGAGEKGRTLMRHIVAHPELGYQIVGFVDDDPQRQHDIGRIKSLGDTSRLPQLVQELNVDEVIITLPWQYHRKIMRILDQCERENVRSRIVPDLFQLSLSHVYLDEIKGIPLIGTREPALQGWNFAVKRLMDITIASVLLVFFAPLMALIALLIKLDSPGPVLFKQVRVGRYGRLFTLYKFRSMRVGAEEELSRLLPLNEADGPLFKMRNDPRVTRVGRWLRRFSLDELPQLWNVLKGDMSLIGPRPALPHEVEQYEPWHRKRLEVPPGLTGLWQTSGRSDMPFDEMCLLDIYYAERWSPWLDAVIFFKTIPAVLFGRGAY